LSTTPRPSHGARSSTDELLIASDHAGAAEMHADHVPGVHRPSVALAHLTVRGEGERALDLCTGNGIQALLLAAHAERVVATDVNVRALAYATFNAALNGADNIETRPGSFFEPVEGEEFDLIVANPPYVVSPESAYLFRDGGMSGDGVSSPSCEPHQPRWRPAASPAS
jgi:methylase of polypeptide subunit release factors